MRVIIAGGGISGLSLGWLLAFERKMDVTVYEPDCRAGGKVWTEAVDGYLCEWGVNGFLDNKPTTLELSAKAGASPLKSFDASRKRFIYAHGKLNRLPESPGAFLKSGIMGIGGKLRLAMEPFIAKGTAEDESLADFGRRRLGSAAFEMLIDPMASGIYAGDPERLSLKSCFPRINELEQTYGSLIKAMISLMRERRKNVSAGPGGVLTSYAHGMQELTDTLHKALGRRVRLGLGISAADKTPSGRYKVKLSDGTEDEADALVFAMPAHALSGVLRDFEPALSNTLAGISYPPLSVIATGFDMAKVNIPVDAFGFLIPFREKRKILGTLYDSSIFPNRAPEGRLLLRSMAGGARAGDIAMMEDARLIDIVLGELRSITGLKAEPVFARLCRHEKAIPQYNVGHSKVVAEVDAMERKHKGLYFTGNAFRGVSLNDCILSSIKIAGRMA